MSKLSDAIAWFKKEFGPQLEAAVKDTPFSVDLLVAIALQETGHIWRPLHTKMATAEILKTCVGDTLDFPKRNAKAFPKNKAALIAAPQGKELFAVCRAALEEMNKHVPGFKAATKNKDKFCHAFGIFQFDIQHFKRDKDYFLKQGWHSFDRCIGHCVGELMEARKAAKLHKKKTLTDEEMVHVAIAYNTGSFNPARKLKQGFRDPTSGKFYGEFIMDFLQASKKVPMPPPAPSPTVAPIAVLPAAPPVPPVPPAPPAPGVTGGTPV